MKKLDIAAHKLWIAKFVHNRHNKGNTIPCACAHINNEGNVSFF